MMNCGTDIAVDGLRACARLLAHAAGWYAAGVGIVGIVLDNLSLSLIISA